MIIRIGCRLAVVGAVVLAAMGRAGASDPKAGTEGGTRAVSTRAERQRMPFWIEQGPTTPATVYADGTELELDSEIVWRPMCGTGAADLTIEDLQRVAAESHAIFDDPDNADNIIVISPDNLRGAGLNIVFNTDVSVPAAALTALETTAQFIESVWSDPITVNINVNFANLGCCVIGQTGSSSPSAPSYATSRAGLINGQDADDTIQDFLPTGSTCPVRYTGTGATVTNETNISFTRANYRATIGASAGSDASMTFNSSFSFDYDPSNGVSGTSFQDVVVHEVGHAMGFTSNVDSGTNDMQALDLYRFAMNDGAGTDWNPDTLAEFQTTARCVDFNTPNDDANSDIISAEFRMSDGDPWQASHFREACPSANTMDPAVCGSQTFYPNFYAAGDLAMFDAIGWDHAVGVCGNSIVEGGEECDPPNGSTCDANCQNFALVTISLPSGPPPYVAPGVATDIDVIVDAGDDTLVGGGPKFYYHFSGGAFIQTNMTNNGGGSYTATLPAPDCTDDPQYYFEAQGAVSGVVRDPSNAPTGFYSSVVGTLEGFIDSFEIDRGWTTTFAAVDGPWERGIPVNGLAWGNDPTGDSDGNGYCFVTDNIDANSDVDTGSVTITSPTIDMSVGGFTISYDYFLHLTDTDGSDRLLVQINNNNGTGAWTQIALHTTDGGLFWTHNDISPAALSAAGVVLTSTMKVRFTANDGGTASIVEAGVDAFSATRFECTGPDNDPPTPNPMTFAVAPAPLSTTSIRMTATTAADATGPVQYFFDFTTGGAFGTDSAWQTSTVYTDSGLSQNFGYGYRVKARDALLNEGAYSSEVQTATAIETPTTAPDFFNLTSTSLTIYTDDLFTDLTGGQSGLLFESTTPGGNGGINAWIQNTQDDVTGLSPNTLYTFRLKARNILAIETGFSPTNSVATLANVPGAPTLSGAACSTMNVAVSNTNGNPAITTYAIQCSATSPSHAAWLNRYVDASGNPSAAAVFRTAAQWGTSAIQGLNGSTTYTFRVKAANQAAPPVETAFGATASLATTSCATCSDGILNQNEVRIDCGGVCAACQCTSDGACADGNVCDGSDTCNAFGQCVNGAPLTCTDGSACTTDTCHAVNGCVFTAITCNDGSACTTDTCNTATGCVFTAITCNDGSACTTDSCNSATGCVFTAINCDDSDGCTIDSCSGGACAHDPADCDDNDACTTDSCAGGVCSHDAIDCDDSDPCTADSCDAGSGCEHDALPCDTGACCASGVCSETTLAACTGFVCNVADHLPPSFIGCFGDVDGNGLVNAGDRGFVSANIGQTDAVLVCVNDLDGNGIINAGDRGFVSANIGFCSGLPDYQDGSGLNHGSPDPRFGAPIFQGLGTTCAGTTCP